MGARFFQNFWGCSARERDFFKMLRMLRTFQNFEDAPHGSAIFSKFRGCSARERNFFKSMRMLRTGVRFSSKFGGCVARERDLRQKRTILNGSVWYRIGIEIFS